MTSLKASRMGAAAAQVLATATGGKVMGVTSKGAFLRSSDSILFVTSAEYHSPFNLTLERTDRLLELLQPGDDFSFEPDCLKFQRVGMSIDTGSAEIWVPPLPTRIISSLGDQCAIASGLAAQLQELDPQKGYLFLLNPRAEHATVLTQNTVALAGGILTQYKQHEMQGFLDCSRQLLGSGSGLTPSGDDFLTGFFLYHIRYGLASGVDDEFIHLALREVTELAFQRTTTISANRLQAAEKGWSEDLFLHLIDHIFDPAIPLRSGFAELLMGFGHSSGVDTFMGIYYALLSKMP